MTNVDEEREWRIAHPPLGSRTAFGLASLLSDNAPPPPGGWLDSLPEAFGALDEHGDVFVIGYKGEWYTPVKLTLRARLHNRLIALGEWLRR
jgi:hypothetical protein